MQSVDVSRLLRLVGQEFEALDWILAPCATFGYGAGLEEVSAVLEHVDVPVPLLADYVEGLQRGLWRAVEAFELHIGDLPTIMGQFSDGSWIADRPSDDASGLAAAAFQAMIDLPFRDQGEAPFVPDAAFGSEMHLEMLSWYVVCFHRLRLAGALVTGEEPVNGMAVRDPGRRVQKWQLGSRIGGGAYGEVFEATKPYLPGQKYAVKIEDMGVASGDYEQISEAQHPHIIRAIAEVKPEQGGIPGHRATVFELGQHDLKTALDMPEPDARSVLRGLAGALHFLHEREPHNRRLHGDIKPANVVKAGARWKLADFGSLRHVDKLATDGLFPFTPNYAAPELSRAYQERTTNGIGTAVDIWALGVSGVELLSGTKFYESGRSIPDGLSGSAQAFLAACLEPSSPERASATDLVYLLDNMERRQQDAADLLHQNRRLVAAAGDNTMSAIWELGRLIDDAVSISDRTQWLWSGCLNMINQGQLLEAKNLLKAADHQQRYSPDLSYPGLERPWLRPRQRSDLAEVIGRQERAAQLDK